MSVVACGCADRQTGENRNSYGLSIYGDMSGQHITEISQYIKCCDVYVMGYLRIIGLYKDN